MIDEESINSYIIMAILILVVLSPFIIGWTMKEPYTKEECAQGSHLMGLKFMPPCTPVGGNALCGLDGTFMVFMICLIGLIIFGVFK